MQKDVKIGIAVGVLLLALIGIFWYMKSHSGRDNSETTVATPGENLPPPGEPVPPSETATLPPAGPDASGAIPAPGTPVTPPAPGAVPPAGPTATGPVPPTPGPGAGPTPEPEPAAASQTYTIVSGDTLGKISKQYYGTEAKWQIIMDANKDKNLDPKNLKVGTVITIPALENLANGGATGAPPSKATKTYTVVKGDTLTKISKKFYGTDAKWRLIQNANKSKVPDADNLQPGIVLTIPAE